jgi:hypothetical protein
VVVFREGVPATEGRSEAKPMTARPPHPLPEARVPFEALSAWHKENGRWPTPETAPEVFADELALTGFAVAQAEPYVPAATLYADALNAAGAFELALRAIRRRVALRLLTEWKGHGRIVGGDRLLLRKKLSAEDRQTAECVKAEIGSLLGDDEYRGWFAGTDARAGSIPATGIAGGK